MKTELDFESRCTQNGASREMLIKPKSTVIVGPPGMSAYEVALKNGFVGTEEEWLNSLKGHVYNANGNLPLSFWVGTQSEYDALPEYNNSFIYMIKEV
ncbi:MAG: phage upper tail fiber protein [Sarcina sp.]